MKKSRFQFRRPCLQEFSFTENKEFDKNVKNVKLRNFLSTRIKKDDKKPFAFVELEIELKAVEMDTPFNLRAVVVTEFLWDGIEDDSQIDKMLKINAPALLVSYLRPLISQVTGFSHFPPYDLPFFNFTEDIDAGVEFLNDNNYQG